MIFRIPKPIAVFAALVLLAVSLIVSTTSATTPYGRGAYNTCTYSVCGQHTIVTTPSGLEVAVNLTNGQVIPPSGYTIEVTPLNGAGSSFSMADFYIDGQFVHSSAPAENGTATWFWDPTQHPGTHVKIIVTDQSGQTVTKEFTVTIGSGVTGGNQSPGEPSSKSKNSFFIVVAGAEIVDIAKKFVHSLPAPLVYTFPWLLFLLLGVEILVLLLQIKRELHEQHVLQELAEQERAVASMKRNLAQLTSHYLRTPLTIINGGLDSIQSELIDAGLMARLRQTAGRLQSTVETLISQVGSNNQQVISEPVTVEVNAPLRSRMGRQAALWSPVILMGLLTYSFIYLANNATSYKQNTVTILIHIIVFTIFVLVIYQLGRRVKLHRQDATAAREILAKEQSVQTAQDSFINSAAANLTGAIQSLNELAKQLPTTMPSYKFVHNGLGEITAVQNKFIVATHLKGGRSTDEYINTTPANIYEKAVTSLSDTAQSKQVRITLVSSDTNLPVQNAGLITLVLHSLLDNAIAYSRQGGDVTVDANATQAQASLSVTDHGSGIPKDKLDVLARPFYRAEGAEDFTHAGMGFSLYLDKLIMAYLGGKLVLESTPGKGTKISANWPVS